MILYQIFLTSDLDPSKCFFFSIHIPAACIAVLAISLPHNFLCANMEASKLVKLALSTLQFERVLTTNESLQIRPLCMITRVCPFYLLLFKIPSTLNM